MGSHRLCLSSSPSRDAAPHSLGDARVLTPSCSSRRLRRRGPRSSAALARRCAARWGAPPGGSRGEARALPPDAQLDLCEPFEFTINLVNIRSLKKNADELTSRLTDLQPDLLAVNETWLDESVEDFALEGYTKVSRLDRRDGRQGGGIMLFAKDAFRNCVHLEDSPCAELSWHMLHTSLGPVFLAVWYRAPDADSTHLLSMMAEWRRLSEGAIATIILGDLNIHQRKWLRYSSANTCEGERLQQFCMENNLRQLVQSPTRDHHLLDVVITDLHVPVRTSVLPKVADHGIVQAVFAMPAPSVKLIPREVWLFQKANWRELNDAFSRLDWRAVLPSDVNGAVDAFSKIVLQTSARFIPRVWRRTRKSTHTRG